MMTIIAQELKGLPKATTMLEVIAWDPCAHKKEVLPVCSLPMTLNWDGVQGTFRGNWAMLRIMGRILAQSSTFVRGLVCDSHGTHSFIKRVVHNQLENVDVVELQNVEFFSKLTHVPLPQNVLPRCPIDVCYYQNEAFFMMVGP